MHDLARLLRMTGGLCYLLVLLVLRSPFEVLHNVLQATFLQFGFDAINNSNLRALHRTGLLFGLGSVLLFLYNGTVWACYATFFTKWIGAIRRMLFGHISTLSLAQIDARPSGDWITRLNADVQVATALLGHPLQLPHAIYLVVNILVSAIILIFIDPRIFAIVVLFVIPYVTFSQLVIAKPMTRLAAKAQEITAANTNDMHALVTCADTAMLYDAQELLLRRFERSSFELRKANMAMRQRTALGAGLLSLMGMSGFLLILLLGGVLIAEGDMSFGNLTAAFQYRGGVLVGAIMLTSSLVNIQTALAGVKRVNETMQMSVEE